MKIVSKLFIIFSLLLASYFINSVSAEGQSVSFTQDSAVRKFVEQTSQKYNIDKNYLYSLLSRTQFLPAVLEKMNQPYEEKPWKEYKKLFVSQERIEAGVAFWFEHRDALAEIETKYGIPADIIVAILGIETKYGVKQGEFPALDTLITLSFYYPPKATFFQNELQSFILLSRIHGFNPEKVLGSYAGALGMCQFMPSSYLYYGISYRGSKQSDLFRNSNDAIASIANYLMQKGWDRDEPVAVEAKIEGRDYKKIIKKDLRKPQAPQYSLENLADYEVYSDDPNDSRMNGYWKAYLVKFDGEKPEYWLAFNNFYVLTLYNNSDLYAMAVYDLARQLQKAYRNYLDIKAKKKIMSDIEQNKKFQ